MISKDSLTIFPFIVSWWLKHDDFCGCNLLKPEKLSYFSYKMKKAKKQAFVIFIVDVIVNVIVVSAR